MKLTVQQDELAAVTGWVTATAGIGKAVARHPMYAAVKITAADDGTVTVTGYDGDVAAVAQMTADGLDGIGEPGTIVVPGKMLAEMARTLPPGPVRITEDGTRATLTARTAACTLWLLPPQEYPALPAAGELAATFAAADLAAAVHQVVFAAGTDDTLPAITCVQLTVGDGTATLAATDRYRLAEATLPCTTAGTPPGPVLIPARRLATISRHGGDSDQIRFTLSGNGAVAGFDDGARLVLTGLYAGHEFPRYRTLIPDTDDSSPAITAEIAVIGAALKRAAVVTPNDRAPVRLGFSSGQMHTDAGAGDDATLAETVPVTTADDALPGPAAFNPRYLADALAAVAAAGAATARITFPRPVNRQPRPAVITTAGPGGGPVTATHVLMPITGAG